jgi:hypothetical protein
MATHWVAPVVFGTDHVEKHPVCIVVVQLLRMLSNGLHHAVSNSNSIVVEACSARCCITTSVVSLFVSKCLLSNWSIRHSMNAVDDVKLLPEKKKDRACNADRATKTSFTVDRQSIVSLQQQFPLEDLYARIE